MSKHTPEPWEVIDRLTIQGPRVAGDPLKCGLLVASPPHWCEPGDSRRIVACVNACRGLPTDELEQKGLVAAVGTQLLDVEQQRDELLTALEAMAECYCEAGSELSRSERAHHRAVYRDVLSAIEKAKAKGGAA